MMLRFHDISCLSVLFFFEIRVVALLDFSLFQAARRARSFPADGLTELPKQDWVLWPADAEPPTRVGMPSSEQRRARRQVPDLGQQNFHLQQTADHGYECPK